MLKTPAPDDHQSRCGGRERPFSFGLESQKGNGYRKRSEMPALLLTALLCAPTALPEAGLHPRTGTLVVSFYDALHPHLRLVRLIV